MNWIVRADFPTPVKVTEVSVNMCIGEKEAGGCAGRRRVGWWE